MPPVDSPPNASPASTSSSSPAPSNNSVSPHLPGADAGPVPGSGGSSGAGAGSSGGASGFEGLLAPDMPDDFVDQVSIPSSAPAAGMGEGVQPSIPAQQQVAPPIPQAAPPQQPMQQGAQAQAPSAAPDIVQLLRENALGLQQQIANEMYAITAEDANAIMMSPGEAIVQLAPQIAARVHYNVMLAVQQLLKTQLPGIIGSTTQRQNMAQQIDQTFSTRWPALKQQHMPLVRALATTFKQQYPNATPMQAIMEVGKQAYGALGIPMPQQQQQQTQSRAAPFVPAASRSVVDTTAPGGSFIDDLISGLSGDYEG